MIVLPVPTYTNKIKFKYTNWKGDDHEYVIQVESVEYGHYDGSGINADVRNWVLHGDVITRDGDSRDDMGTRRRTFLIEKIRDPEEILR